MQDVTRKRIMRKLEALPEEQLYQVLDYIEFVELKYAAIAARKPDRFQQFAERVEDQMRVRALAPRAVKGTMKLMSTASRMLDGVRDLGRDLWTGPAPGSKSADSPDLEPADDDGSAPEGQSPGGEVGNGRGPAEAEEDAER